MKASRISRNPCQHWTNCEAAPAFCIQISLLERFCDGSSKKLEGILSQISKAKAAADEFRRSSDITALPRGSLPFSGLITPDDFGRRRRRKRENVAREMIGLAPLRFFRADSL
ncbi:hypothetical protein CDAR_604351 [Caerostris darwini]|uniref:Uncharacterized protein n=1 Tax=Caerostris darwini TaxID=1538125 RepID=A0AAV4SY97_9ARAC|nr:hypothetical protein CDAR_604351 [Caerostris darwini]